MTTRTAVFASLSALLALALSCAQRDAQYPLPPEPIGKATLHAAQSRELRAIMSDLRTLSFDRLPQELDERDRVGVSRRRAAAIGSDLAAAAERISGIASETGLDANEQTTFVSLAGRLRSHALELRSVAEEGDDRAILSTFEQINAACVSCHQLFRDRS